MNMFIPCDDNREVNQRQNRQTDMEMDRLIEAAALNSQIRDVEVSEYPPGQ